jgi:hypothetical protein
MLLALLLPLLGCFAQQLTGEAAQAAQETLVVQPMRGVVGAVVVVAGLPIAYSLAA